MTTPANRSTFSLIRCSSAWARCPITAVSTGWSLKLTTRVGTVEDVRSLDANDCSVLADAAAGRGGQRSGFAEKFIGGLFKLSAIVFTDDQDSISHWSFLPKNLFVAVV